MTEALLSLSIGFFAYVVYVFVDEQRKLNRKPAEKKTVATKPSTTTKPKKPGKAASAKKTKPKAAATAKKQAPPKANLASEAILTYLGKNGLTTVAKLSRELPGGKKSIQDGIDQLIREGKLSQSTVGRAKAIDLKA